MRNKQGFTLMELMIALAILAIVATLGVPSFTGWRDDAKLRDGASLLRGDLERAKLRAIEENDFVAIIFNTDGYIVFVDDGGGDPLKAGDWSIDGAEQIVCNRQFTAGVRIDLAATDFNGSDQTRFNARGRISDDGGVRLVNTAGNQRQVNINRFGMITVN